jgi:hypothetical protein
VVEREAAGDFDYLFDDPADDAGVTRHGQGFDPVAAAEFAGRQPGPDDDMWDEPDDSFWDNQPDPRDNGHFDAFDPDQWRFAPTPTPWYRTRMATAAIVAAGTATAAIVVSGVLLVFHGAGARTINDLTSSVTPTAPTSAPPQTVSSQAPTTALAPSTAPPPTGVASPEVGAPRSNPATDAHPSKSPEFNVTRTPMTRLPLSVAPQQRSRGGPH